MNKRTPKESSIIVEKTIEEIDSYKKITNELITSICLKNNISESHIRTVAGWKKREDNILK